MNFTIEIQQDKNNGCIPACFLSVLHYLELDNLGLNENDLIYEMYPTDRSGFDRLKDVIDAKDHPDWEIIINDYSNNPHFLEENNKAGIPVLHAVLPAHCVVITEADCNCLLYHDPHDGSSQRISYHELALRRGNHGHQLIVCPK